MSARRVPVLVAVYALAAAPAVVGIVFLTHRPAAPTDRAFVDRAATTQVTAQVGTALDEVLSYDYRHPTTAAAAAKEWLTGDAPAQYQLLFRQLQTLAKGQQLTLVAKVSSVGVSSLHASSAQLLVFLDQRSTRASDGQSSVSAAQVQIGAVKQDGRWRISELKPL